MIKVIEQGSYMNRVDKLPDGLYSAMSVPPWTSHFNAVAY